MFELESHYNPTGDQPSAIKKLVDGINHDKRYQILLGITGSGKTYTMANVISQVNKPTLILSHNKTLAAQLYNEMKSLFPNNLVEYYVSYYDYYKPESYIPANNVYIAKTLKINHDLEKLRMGAIVALLRERKDVIVVSSVSCIYGIENPQQFKKAQLLIKVNDTITQDDVVISLDNLFYENKNEELKHGEYRIRRNTVDVFVSHDDIIFRIKFGNNRVESIQRLDPLSGDIICEEAEVVIFSTKLFAVTKDTLEENLKEIEKELEERVAFFKSIGKNDEATRIRERTEYDISMIREMGYCSGIENYSGPISGRARGEPPATLLHYFPDDYLLLIDESHVTIPQLRAMYAGDRARKKNLIDNGFRLPSAYDHRPLRFDEFETFTHKVIFVSATPGKYEICKSGNDIVEQIIRPTGLLDPEIEVRPTEKQLIDVINEIKKRIVVNEKVFITTLTKKMAEELNDFLIEHNIKSQYLHSSVKTLDRVKILENLEKGITDVVVGVNLLREGLDVPEVSLVIILDADKEGFLRDVTSLIQTIGRAARNVHGKVIMYGDFITHSMKVAIEETLRRRTLQMQYNQNHSIIPKTARKVAKTNLLVERMDNKVNFDIDERIIKKMSVKEFSGLKRKIKNEMLKASKQTNFIKADKLKEKLDILLKIRTKKDKTQSE